MFKLKSIFCLVYHRIRALQKSMFEKNLETLLLLRLNFYTTECQFTCVKIHLYHHIGCNSQVGVEKALILGGKFNFHYSWLFFSYDVGRLYWFIHIVVLMTSENIDSCYFYCHRINRRATGDSSRWHSRKRKLVPAEAI